MIVQIPIYKSQRRKLIALGALIVIGAIAALWWRAAHAEIAPIRYIQTPGDVGEVRYIDDGRLLMTSDYATGMVRFYDAQTGKLVREWQGDGGQIIVSSDSQRALEASPFSAGHATVTLRDALTGNVLRKWPGDIAAEQSDFSLIVTEDNYLPLPAQIHGPRLGHVIEPATGRVIVSFPIDDSFSDQFSRDGHFLCLPKFDAPPRLLRLPSLTPTLPSVEFPNLMVIRVTDDDRAAYGVSRNGALHFWTIPSGAHSATSTGMSYARSAFQLRTGALCVEGEIGNSQNRRSVLEIRSPDGVRLLHVVPGTPMGFSANSRYVACQIWESSNNDHCDIFDLQTGKRLARLDTQVDQLGNRAPQSAEDIWATVAVSSDGRQCAYASRGGLLRLYDLTGKTQRRPHFPISTSEGRVVQPLNDDIQSDPSDPREAENFTAAALPGGGVKVESKQFAASPELPFRWLGEQASNTAVQSVNGSKYEFTNCQISPDGKLVAVDWQRLVPTYNSGVEQDVMIQDGLVDLRDAHTGKLLKTLLPDKTAYHRTGRTDYLGKPAFSADSALVAVPCEVGRVFVYDVASGRQIGEISGARVAVPSDDYGAGYAINYAAYVAFAPDKRSLAVVRNDGAIYLYSLATFQPIAQIGQTPRLLPSYHGNQPAPLRWMEFDARGKKLYGIPINGINLMEWDLPSSDAD